MMRTTSPRVLISYSHDSPEHEVSILSLANRLRSHGIDCRLDQYNPWPPEGWTAWMECEITQAEFVIMVCTETYRRRFDGKEELGKGRGVLWEARIIRKIACDCNPDLRKFIPALVDAADKGYIPTWLADQSYVNPFTEIGYENLYRRLTDQIPAPIPGLGPLRVLSLQTLAPAISLERHPQWNVRPDSGWLKIATLTMLVVAISLAQPNHDRTERHLLATVAPVPKVVLVEFDADDPLIGRKKHSALIRHLRKAGARAVVFDLRFAKSRAGTADLKQAMSDSGDMRISLPYLGDPPDLSRVDESLGANKAINFVHPDVAIDAPPNVVLGHAGTIGTNGKLDRVVLQYRNRGDLKPVPHLSLSALIAPGHSLTRPDSEAEKNPTKVTDGISSWPVDEAWCFHPNWSMPLNTVQHRTYSSLLATLEDEGKLSQQLVRGNIVVVGATNKDDPHDTPLGKMSGAMFISCILNALMPQSKASVLPAPRSDGHIWIPLAILLPLLGIKFIPGFRHGTTHTMPWFMVIILLVMGIAVPLVMALISITWCNTRHEIWAPAGVILATALTVMILDKMRSMLKAAIHPK